MSFLKPTPAKSVSENINNPLITSTYSPVMQQGVGANNFMSSLLMGQGDTGAANAGYNNYLQQAGYAPAMKQLSKSITGQMASAGLLNSGSTMKALQSRGAELNQGFYNNYLQQLMGLSNQGLQAGGLIANTGQKSTSTGGSPSTLGSIASTVGGIAGIPGVGKVFGKVFGKIFSDRRLKQDIKLLRRDPDGLGWYEFAYLWAPAKKIIGVMADEIAKLRPQALGPIVQGYATVDYGAL